VLLLALLAAAPAVAQTRGINSTASRSGRGATGPAVPFQSVFTPGPAERQAAARALIDPVTQLRLAGQRMNAAVVTPLVPLYFPPTQVIVIPTPPVVIEAPVAAPQPQVILIAGPAGAGLREASSEPGREEPAEAGAAKAAPPLRELAELVLVRRDGREIGVVAWSRQGERVVYVTRQGQRRILAAAEIDFEATQRRNEQDTSD
jgi:hypothetical protein